MVYTPTNDERVIIARCADPLNGAALVSFAAAWNLLDPSILDGLLDDRTEYSSQSVEEVIHGERRIIEYLSAKFSTLRLEGERVLVRVELALHVSSGEHCLLMHQRQGMFGGSGLGSAVAVISVKMTGNHVAMISLATASDRISEAVGTGKFPGIPKGRIEEDKAFRGKTLGRAADMEFIVVSPSTIPGLENLLGLVGGIAGERRSSRAQFWFTDVDGDVPDFWGIRSFPTIVVKSGGHVVGLVDGGEPDEEIRSGLLAFFGDEED